MGSPWQGECGSSWSLQRGRPHKSCVEDTGAPGSRDSNQLPWMCRCHVQRQEVGWRLWHLQASWWCILQPPSPLTLIPYAVREHQGVSPIGKMMQGKVLTWNTPQARKERCSLRWDSTILPGCRTWINLFPFAPEPVSRIWLSLRQGAKPPFLVTLIYILFLNNGGIRMAPNTFIRQNFPTKI